MEQKRHREMIGSIERLHGNGMLSTDIFLFAHCNASLEIADELIGRGFKPVAILDNNPAKYELKYKGIPVCSPQEILKYTEATVLIASRFYEQMAGQLRRIGFEGRIEKVVDYNPYAEYSTSQDTVRRKKERVKRGISVLDAVKGKHPGDFLVFCPLAALGDVYFCMSYLGRFLSSIGRNSCTVCVVGSGCGRVAELFGYTQVEVMSQNDLDDAVQAVIYTDDKDCYIAHQDRPYVVDLHKALYLKCIPLETIYKCGVFGLPIDTEPIVPIRWRKGDFEGIREGKSVILSPYAKSVTALPNELWADIISYYTDREYDVYTNISGDEKPLPGTGSVNAGLSEVKSLVERAGIFIGIRSGLCDVLRTAECVKIALYPDYFYSDTRWKSIDMYALDEFKNIMVKEKDTWEKIVAEMK